MKVNQVDWHVSQCACGHVTLRLGSVQMEFTKEQFAELHQMVGEAMNEFGITRSERPLFRLSSRSH